MPLLTTTADVAAFCQTLPKSGFITVDTEFMRDRTYWSQLCLIQVGGPGQAKAIDPLAKGLNLEPLWEVLQNPNLIKVFHAARQDIEIFVQLGGFIPAPILDTQVMAMVCGFGEQASYESLVQKILGQSLDKSQRFTDWGRRPLNPEQVQYALDDVIHLRPIYEHLQKQLEERKREEWVAEEMDILRDPAAYETDPEKSWERLRPRTTNPKFLGVLQTIAAWREREAQRRNIPRGRLLKDDMVLELAARPPQSMEDFGKLRRLPPLDQENKQSLLSALQDAKKLPPAKLALPPLKPPLNARQSAMLELLRVLLRLKCEQHDVAAKLVANSEDLENFARGEKGNLPFLHGWRYQIFGEDAEKLAAGKLALGLNGKGLALIDAA